MIKRTLMLYFSFIIPCSLNAALPLDKDGIVKQDKLSINAGIGYLGGESKEYVYEDGRTLSQLNWKIEQAAILLGEINYDLFQNIALNAAGWVTAGMGNAKMDDYDWLNPNQSTWTEWSHHEDTELRYANQIDLNLRGWLMENEHVKLGLMAGYQRNSFSFLARGGCFQYSSGQLIGCFPANEIGIGYQQTFNTGYLGALGHYEINALDVNAAIKYGPYVKSNDVDQHYARSLTFKESGNEASFYSLALDTGYRMNPQAKVYIKGAINYFSHTNANTEMINRISGERDFLTNAAGLKNTNYMLALGIQYKPFAT
ncbi:omptin family outer membrane protease [Legionella impletisoli]|uniref:Outer membrane protease n=1 Tax=Legionella impletisoli TaxID=343510 RepID=A0A917NA29_9GAMM|nr:omptin family outer membrane protease [Legionella impletisoli]GGI81901.1 outer membrane protease [Legionella impletisoli]